MADVDDETLCASSFPLVDIVVPKEQVELSAAPSFADSIKPSCMMPVGERMRSVGRLALARSACFLRHEV